MKSLMDCTNVTRSNRYRIMVRDNINMQRNVRELTIISQPLRQKTEGQKQDAVNGLLSAALPIMDASGL